jgi:hypothetical protein
MIVLYDLQLPRSTEINDGKHDAGRLLDLHLDLSIDLSICTLAHDV